MKIKYKSKVGFTLLEVVLSIAIMLTMTTMMMNGFAATMSYSYHTSIYNNTAGTNYSQALKTIATNFSNGMGAYAHMGVGTKDTDGTTTITKTPKLVATKSFTGVGTIKLNVQVYRYATGASSVSTFTIDSDDPYVDSNVESWFSDPDGSYSNNRTSFYYLPGEMGDAYTDGTNNHGRFRVYYNSSDGKYYWLDKQIVDDNGNTVPGDAFDSAEEVKFS